MRFTEVKTPTMTTHTHRAHDLVSDLEADHSHAHSPEGQITTQESKQGFPTTDKPPRSPKDWNSPSGPQLTSKESHQHSAEVTTGKELETVDHLILIISHHLVGGHVIE